MTGRRRDRGGGRHHGPFGRKRKPGTGLSVTGGGRRSRRPSPSRPSPARGGTSGCRQLAVPLADLGPVGVRGVDEGDVERHGPPQRLDGPVPIGRITQTPGPVVRIAPYPSRLTVRSPPTSILPAARPAFADRGQTGQALAGALTGCYLDSRIPEAPHGIPSRLTGQHHGRSGCPRRVGATSGPGGTGRSTTGSATWLTRPPRRSLPRRVMWPRIRWRTLMTIRNMCAGG